MSKKLKESFNKKMGPENLGHFDQAFFKKLEQERDPKTFLSKYFGWSLSTVATALVVVIALNVNREDQKNSLRYQEYINLSLELEESLDENLTDDAEIESIDLTSASADEI